MGLAIKSLYAPSHHCHLYDDSAGFRVDLKDPDSRASVSTYLGFDASIA